MYAFMWIFFANTGGYTKYGVPSRCIPAPLHAG